MNREEDERRIAEEEQKEAAKEDAENLELERYLADAEREAENRAEDLEQSRNF